MDDNENDILIYTSAHFDKDSEVNKEKIDKRDQELDEIKIITKFLSKLEWFKRQELPDEKRFQIKLIGVDESCNVRFTYHPLHFSTVDKDFLNEQENKHLFSLIEEVNSRIKKGGR